MPDEQLKAAGALLQRSLLEFHQSTSAHGIIVLEDLGQRLSVGRGDGVFPGHKTARAAQGEGGVEGRGQQQTGKSRARAKPVPGWKLKACPDAPSREKLKIPWKGRTKLRGREKLLWSSM
jgi:hypothetical protein